MSKKIFWIASYPKSGNTWIRSIIAGLFYTNDGIFDFTKLNFIKYFENNERFNFIKDINPKDFNNIKKIEIISKYWVSAQKNITITSGDFNFFKTHSANIKIDNNHYTNKDNVLGLIYIVRDPRDISISYAAHKGTSIDKIIQIMKNKNSLTYTNGLPIIQSSWDVHYLSWVNLSVPKIIIKYENMLEDPEKYIYNMVDFLTKNFNFKFNNLETKIDNILKTTNFLELQKKEGGQGFNEATTNSPFFRKGTSNQWKDKLNNTQTKIIKQSFEKVMGELKY